MSHNKGMDNLQDFTFRPHFLGFQAVRHYDNGFGVSVVPERDGETYEVAVMSGPDEARMTLCYTSGLTNDVFRFQTVDEVHRLCLRVRNLAPGTYVEEEA